jgi:hypothetical protein
MNRVAWSFNAVPSRRIEVGVRNYLSYPRHEVQPLPDGFGIEVIRYLLNWSGQR